MTYIYSQENMLEKPQTYMYAKFQGEALLSEYIASRQSKIESISKGVQSNSSRDVTLVYQFIKQFIHYSPESLGLIVQLKKLQKTIEKVPAFNAEYPMGTPEKRINTNIETTVDTLELLYGLAIQQLFNIDGSNTKIWLDRLIQRFEVSKKLYAFYPPGFRKGHGSIDIIQLYWLLALNLSFYYKKTTDIKYLSTFLKVCDLLCSLPEESLVTEVSKQGLAMVFMVEVDSIKLLCLSKEVDLDIK